MTFRIRVEDPASLSVTEYDLDEPEDRERFEDIYGEATLVRVEHLEESESLEITCVERVDEWADPTPAPELIPVPCKACRIQPNLNHDAEGYRFICPQCRVTTVPHPTLRMAVEAWGAVQW